MADREKVTGHLNDCLSASRSDNSWVFVRKDIISDVLELLKENDIELERIYQNICTYINGDCSTDTEADKQHVCEMIGRIFCAGGRVVLTNGVEAQGRWIHNGLGEYHCTICGEAVYLDNGSPMGEGYQYCPFCGAKIDEEVEQDVHDE